MSARPILALVILAGCLGLGKVTEGGLSVSLLALAILTSLCIATATFINAIKN